MKKKRQGSRNVRKRHRATLVHELAGRFRSMTVCGKMLYVCGTGDMALLVYSNPSSAQCSFSSFFLISFLRILFSIG